MTGATSRSGNENTLMTASLNRFATPLLAELSQPAMGSAMIMVERWPADAGRICIHPFVRYERTVLRVSVKPIVAARGAASNNGALIGAQPL